MAAWLLRARSALLADAPSPLDAARKLAVVNGLGEHSRAQVRLRACCLPSGFWSARNFSSKGSCTYSSMHVSSCAQVCVCLYWHLRTLSPHTTRWAYSTPWTPMVKRSLTRVCCLGLVHDVQPIVPYARRVSYMCVATLRRATLRQ